MTCRTVMFVAGALGLNTAIATASAQDWSQMSYDNLKALYAQGQQGPAPAPDDLLLGQTAMTYSGRCFTPSPQDRALNGDLLVLKDGAQAKFFTASLPGDAAYDSDYFDDKFNVQPQGADLAAFADRFTGVSTATVSGGQWVDAVPLISTQYAITKVDGHWLTQTSAPSAIGELYNYCFFSEPTTVATEYAALTATFDTTSSLTPISVPSALNDEGFYATSLRCYNAAANQQAPTNGLLGFVQDQNGDIDMGLLMADGQPAAYFDQQLITRDDFVAWAGAAGLSPATGARGGYVVSTTNPATQEQLDLKRFRNANSVDPVNEPTGFGLVEIRAGTAVNWICESAVPLTDMPPPGTGVTASSCSASGAPSCSISCAGPATCINGLPKVGTSPGIPGVCHC